MIKLRSSITNLTLTQNFLPNNQFSFKLKKFASNVQAIVDNFNEKFHDLVFNASELFSPKYYPIEENTHFNIWE